MTAKVIALLPMTDDRDELSDDALLALCARRDPAALGALYRRHHLAVYRFASRLLGPSNADIDDLVQQVFLAAWQGAARFRRESPVCSWLFGIAANIVKKQQRKRTRWRVVLAELLARTPPSPPLLDEEAAHKQLVERLAWALDQLPHDLKVAYLMCEVENVSGVESAKALGVRPGTMWRRLHQARKQLRDLIQAGVAR